MDCGGKHYRLPISTPHPTSYLYASIDMYGIALYKLFGAHLDVLANQLALIGQRHRYRDNRSVDRLAPVTVAWQSANEQQLYGCIRYHMLCLEFAERLNEIVSLQYFMQFGMSVTVFCASEFKLMKLDPFEESVKYLSVVLYLLGLVFQIFLPCYLGSVVKAKSGRLLRAIYESNWTEQSADYKMAVIVFAERTKQEITPKAGSMFALDLPMFLSVSVRVCFVFKIIMVEFYAFSDYEVGILDVYIVIENGVTY